MDCKEFERLIPDFVSDKLDYQNLKRFISHMNHCEDCQEELTIQFLVTEGMQRLEDGGAFDLQKELRQRLEVAKKNVRFHDIFLRIGLVLEIAAVGLLAGCMIWVLL
ncbi:MAG: zf-HC2 domain-containing protein [Acetatifactor sp.]|nr:zf-HC2 domain-containing protein [Acetatifactor sp.]